MRTYTKSLIHGGKIPTYCPTCGASMRAKKRHEGDPTTGGAVSDALQAPAGTPAVATQGAPGGFLLLQANDEKRYTLSVVQTPNEKTYPTIVDRKGRKEVWEVSYPPRVVQDMAHNFALDGNFGSIGLLHAECPKDATQPIRKPNGENGKVVESFLAPADFQVVDPSGQLRSIKQGSWLAGIIWSETVWPRVRSGELGALSLATDTFEVEAVDE